MIEGLRDFVDERFVSGPFFLFSFLFLFPRGSVMMTGGLRTFMSVFLLFLFLFHDCWGRCGWLVYLLADLLARLLACLVACSLDHLLTWLLVCSLAR